MPLPPIPVRLYRCWTLAVFHPSGQVLSRTHLRHPLTPRFSYSPRSAAPGVFRRRPLNPPEIVIEEQRRRALRLTLRGLRRLRAATQHEDHGAGRGEDDLPGLDSKKTGVA